MQRCEHKRIKLWLQPDGCPVLDTTAAIAARKRAKLLGKDQGRGDDHTVEGVVSAYFASVLDAGRPDTSASKQANFFKDSSSSTSSGTSSLWLFQPDAPSSIHGSAHLISLVNTRWELLQQQSPPAASEAAAGSPAQQHHSPSSLGTSWGKVQKQLQDSSLQLSRPKDLVGHRIKVWWPQDSKHYEGLVTDYYCHNSNNSTNTLPLEPDSATDVAGNPAPEAAAVRDAPRRGRPPKDAGSRTHNRSGISGQGKDTTAHQTKKRGRPTKQQPAQTSYSNTATAAQDSKKRGRPPKPRGPFVWGKHRIEYDDGEVELVDLSVEEWMLTEAEVDNIKQQQKQLASKGGTSTAAEPTAQGNLPAAGDVLLTFAVDRHRASGAAAEERSSRRAERSTRAATTAQYAGSGRNNGCMRYKKRRHSAPSNAADKPARQLNQSEAAVKRSKAEDSDSDSDPDSDSESSSSGFESSSGSESSDSDYANAATDGSQPSASQERMATRKRQADAAQPVQVTAAAADDGSLSKRSKAETVVVPTATTAAGPLQEAHVCPTTAAAVPLTVLVAGIDSLPSRADAAATTAAGAVKPQPAQRPVAAPANSAAAATLGQPPPAASAAAGDVDKQRKSPFLGILASKFRSYMAGGVAGSSSSSSGHASLQAATAAAAAAAISRAVAAQAAGAAPVSSTGTIPLTAAPKAGNQTTTVAPPRAATTASSAETKPSFQATVVAAQQLSMSRTKALVVSSSAMPSAASIEASTGTAPLAEPKAPGAITLATVQASPETAVATIAPANASVQTKAALLDASNESLSGKDKPPSCPSAIRAATSQQPTTAATDPAVATSQVLGAPKLQVTAAGAATAVSNKLPPKVTAKGIAAATASPAGGLSPTAGLSRVQKHSTSSALRETSAWQHVPVLKAFALPDAKKVKPAAASVTTALDAAETQVEAMAGVPNKVHSNEQAVAVEAVTPARKLLDELTARLTQLDAAATQTTHVHGADRTSECNKQGRMQMQILLARDNMQFSLLTHQLPLGLRGHRAAATTGHSAVAAAAAGAGAHSSAAVSAEAAGQQGLVDSSADDNCLAVLLMKLPAGCDPATVTVTSSNSSLEVRYEVKNDNTVTAVDGTSAGRTTAATAEAEDTGALTDMQQYKKQQQQSVIREIACTVCLPIDMEWVNSSSNYSSSGAAVAATAVAPDMKSYVSKRQSVELVGLLQYSSLGGKLMVLGRCCKCR